MPATRPAFIALKHLPRVGEGDSLRDCKPGDEVPEASGWSASWFNERKVEKGYVPADQAPPKGWRVVDGVVMRATEDETSVSRGTKAKAASRLDETLGKIRAGA